VGDDLATVVSRDASGVVHVALSGEIDLTTAESVQQQLEQAIAGHGEVTVDLRAVTYIDSRGIRLLVHVARDFRAGGGRMRVVAPRETVAGGVLRLTHVDELELDGDDLGRDPAAS
jgi:anti-anti-sigma factor